MYFKKNQVNVISACFHLLSPYVGLRQPRQRCAIGIRWPQDAVTVEDTVMAVIVAVATADGMVAAMADETAAAVAATVAMADRAGGALSTAGHDLVRPPKGGVEQARWGVSVGE